MTSEPTNNGCGCGTILIGAFILWTAFIVVPRYHDCLTNKYTKVSALVFCEYKRQEYMRAGDQTYFGGLWTGKFFLWEPSLSRKMKNIRQQIFPSLNFY